MRGSSARKAGAVIGPFSGTEFYVNGGLGFHSNDARGATITRDPSTGAAADPVTPLVRAKGAEVGVRTRRHSAPADQPDGMDALAGVRAAVRRGRRHDRSQPAESPLRDRVRQLLRAAAVADCSTATCHGRTAHFTDVDPVGDRIPGSVATVISGGATLDSLHNIFGSIRCATSVRVRWSRTTRCVRRRRAWSISRPDTGWTGISRSPSTCSTCSNARDSDIDYYYTSRLFNEPADGVNDLHLHPALPRTARVNLIVGF